MSDSYMARIMHKRDTNTAWMSNDPLILEGEIILVTMDDGSVRMKIGDGSRTYSQLPFSDEPILEDIGTLSKLNTKDKTSLVNAINEVGSNKGTKVVVQDTEPTDTSALWIDPSDDSSDDIVSKEYLVEVFIELKSALEAMDSAAAIAVLDNAILDMTTLA